MATITVTLDGPTFTAGQVADLIGRINDEMQAGPRIRLDVGDEFRRKWARGCLHGGMPITGGDDRLRGLSRIEIDMRAKALCLEAAECGMWERASHWLRALSGASCYAA